MLYIAFVRMRRDVPSGDVGAKSQRWWNEGGRPEGLRTVAMHGTLSTEAPDVFVLEANDHGDIGRMISFWRSVADIEVHPAVDLAGMFRSQGMKVE